MKRTFYMLLAAVLVFSCLTFVSCEEKVKESSAIPSDIISSLVSSLAWEDTTLYTKADLDSMDSEEKEARISVLYGALDGSLPDFSVFEDMAFVISGELSACEIGIFKLSAENNTEEKINEAKAFMTLRVNNVKEIFSGYAPDAVAMAENAVVESWGRYVYYVMAEDSSAVNTEIIKALEEKA